MKGLLLTISVLAAACALAVGVSGAPAANHAPRAGVKVAVASTTLGPVLVDGRGHTLYLFEKDAHGKSACAGQCAAYWPPLIASGKPVATAGAKASLLGTTRRTDGRLQVTYNHHPLYTFVKDTATGQMNGEAVSVFGAEWFAVSAAGFKVEKDDLQSSGNGNGSGSGAPSAGGYGY